MTAAAVACSAPQDHGRRLPLRGHPGSVATTRDRRTHPAHGVAALRNAPGPVRAIIDKPFTGDFDEMVKRRAIRVAVTFNRTHYFIDRGQERGTDLRVAEVVREPI